MDFINDDARSRWAANSLGGGRPGDPQSKNQAKDAIVESVLVRNGTGYVTVYYRARGSGHRQPMQLVTLIVGRNTKMRDQFGNRIGLRSLRKDMVVDAVFSSAMTRSNPPQARAFSVTIVKENQDSFIEEGRVVSVDVAGEFGYILTGNAHNINRQMRYVISNTTKIRDRRGNRITLRAIRPGQIIRVERASFQTASIPPQTTAFTVQIVSR